jgi:hypothetical protein
MTTIDARSARIQHMSMLKVIEVLAESDKSWEDAAAGRGR